jgi:hypothetical protein
MRKTLLVCLTLAFFLVGSAVFAATEPVSASPASLSFGDIAVSAKSSARTIEITNTYGHPVSIYLIYSSAQEFSVISPSLPIALAANGKTSFSVVFEPYALRSFSADILVDLKNAEGNTYRVSIPVTGTGNSKGATGSGTGTGTSSISSSASSLSFGSTLVGASASKTVSLTNSGSGSLTISQASVSGSAFSVSGLTGSTTLSSGKSLTLTVNFSPSGVGNDTGSLNIVSNASTPSLAISLSGAGVQPAIAVVPTSVSFENVSVGVTDTQSVTIKNTGTANLTISQATLAGSSFSMSGMSMPMSIAPGATSTISVAFKPSSASTFYANLSLVNNSPTSPLVVPVSGSSVASVLQLSASPSSLSFGSLTTGTTSTKSVTLTNSGNSSITISSIAVSGTGFTPASLSLPLTLAAGQSTSFSVVFAPTSAATLTGTATVTSTATNSPLTVALTGTGTAAATYSVSLSWTASSTSFAGFNIYRGTQSGGPYSKVNSSLITTTSYSDATVSAGNTYYYVATEESSSGTESGYSSQVTATVP